MAFRALVAGCFMEIFDLQRFVNIALSQACEAVLIRHAARDWQLMGIFTDSYKKNEKK